MKYGIKRLKNTTAEALVGGKHWENESVGWIDQLGHATLYVLEITAMSIKKMSAAKPENVLLSTHKKIISRLQ